MQAISSRRPVESTAYFNASVSVKTVQNCEVDKHLSPDTTKQQFDKNESISININGERALVSW